MKLYVTTATLLEALIGQLWGRGGWGVDQTPPHYTLVSKNENKSFFLGAVSLWRVVVPFLKIVINLPRTNEKLHCKGDHIGLVVISSRQKKNITITLYKRMTMSLI